MPLVTSTEMFKKAYEGGYAIGAFNVNNMEIVQAITEACKEEKAPVILQVSKGARAYANHTYLVKLVEAAVIDGAGPFRIFFRIVLPTISPTTFYLLVTGIIGLLQAFATTFTLGSSLTTQSLTIVYYMYNYMMAYDLGVAGAAAWILAIFILIVTLIQFIGSRRWVKYD